MPSLLAPSLERKVSVTDERIELRSINKKATLRESILFNDILLAKDEPIPDTSCTLVHVETKDGATTSFSMDLSEAKAFGKALESAYKASRIPPPTPATPDAQEEEKEEEEEESAADEAEIATTAVPISIKPVQRRINIWGRLLLVLLGFCLALGGLVALSNNDKNGLASPASFMTTQFNMTWMPTPNNALVEPKARTTFSDNSKALVVFPAPLAFYKPVAFINSCPVDASFPLSSFLHDKALVVRTSDQAAATPVFSNATPTTYITTGKTLAASFINNDVTVQTWGAVLNSSSLEKQAAVIKAFQGRMLAYASALILYVEPPTSSTNSSSSNNSEGTNYSKLARGVLVSWGFLYAAHWIAACIKRRIDVDLLTALGQGLFVIAMARENLFLLFSPSTSPLVVKVALLGCLVLSWAAQTCYVVGLYCERQNDRICELMRAAIIYRPISRPPTHPLFHVQG